MSKTFKKQPRSPGWFSRGFGIEEEHSFPTKQVGPGDHGTGDDIHAQIAEQLGITDASSSREGQLGLGGPLSATPKLREDVVPPSYKAFPLVTFSRRFICLFEGCPSISSLHLLLIPTSFLASHPIATVVNVDLY